MSDKKYVLELSAEELESLDKYRKLSGTVLTATKEQLDKVDGRVSALIAQAKADRADDELRLPWRAKRTMHSDGPAWWVEPWSMNGWSEGAARLASAAPELLEAVKAVERYMSLNGPEFALRGRWHHEIVPLLERAMRKVETGVPE